MKVLSDILDTFLGLNVKKYNSAADAIRFNAFAVENADVLAETIKDQQEQIRNLLTQLETPCDACGRWEKQLNHLKTVLRDTMGAACGGRYEQLEAIVGLMDSNCLPPSQKWPPLLFKRVIDELAKRMGQYAQASFKAKNTHEESSCLGANGALGDFKNWLLDDKGPEAHTYYKCDPCKNEGQCQFCDGGLLLCTVCKQGESELTESCPGPKEVTNG